MRSKKAKQIRKLARLMATIPNNPTESIQKEYDQLKTAYKKTKRK
jgi:hypothetical protein